MNSLTNVSLRSFPAFTLVELIVVITIVGILSTVGFVSYSGYLTGARDSNRFSQLTKLSDSLQTYAATKSLPLPDDYIEVHSSGATIAYQGYVGTDVLETIDYTNGWKDPKDDSFFTYYLTKDRKKLQLLAFMEETVAAHNLPLWSTLYAAEYGERFPKVYGQKLWVLVSADDATLNTPAQEILVNQTAGLIELNSAPQEYSALLDNDGGKITASGYTLWALLSTRLWEDAPTDCPEGFIGVPGNPEFDTRGFCVARYEMTYSDADTPNSTVGGTDWNTVAYVPDKPIVSIAGKYPIADINQAEAIAACQSMGRGYHLITNNQWMTIGRSIEANPANWSSGTIGVGSLSNGVSNDLTLGCNGTWGNSEPRTWATKTWPGDASCNPRRSHRFAQWGGTIWDFSGNVWEHVNKANSIDGTGYNTGQTALAWSSAPTVWDDNGIYDPVDMQLYGAATWGGRAQGMWNLYYAQWVANNIFYRGGRASHGSSAGVFALNLNYTAGLEGGSLGFRCVQ